MHVNECTCSLLFHLFFVGLIIRLLISLDGCWQFVSFVGSVHRDLYFFSRRNYLFTVVLLDVERAMIILGPMFGLLGC